MRIAFIGLGHMGAPMAANLLRAGHVVVGYDLATDLRIAAQEAGVAPAGSSREAVEGVDAVITMLPNGESVMSVWREVAPELKGRLLVDCSTIDLDSALRVHKCAQEAGAHSLDAPVSGGVAGAKAATLTFMCGGEAEAIDMARPVLGAMGRQLLHCGGAGMGQASKLCNNMMLGVTMIATAEAFLLAEHLGLSHKALFDAASISSGQSWSLTSYCPVPEMTPSSPANNDYQAGFMSALMLKDLKLAQNAAMRAGAVTPLGAMAAQLYALHVAMGEGEADFSAIIRMLRAGRPDGGRPLIADAR